MKKPATTSKHVVATLNREQANALVLYLNYKKYHWLSYGPLFRDLHLLFDDLASHAYETIDELAERALMLGGKPIADAAAYLPNASIKASAGDLTMRRMVEEAVRSLDHVIGELHADADTATAAGDIGTADLYTRLVQVHQKDRWFLRQVLEKNDGLV